MNGYTIYFLNIIFLKIPNVLQFHLANQEAPLLILPWAEPRCSTLIFLTLVSVIKDKDLDTTIFTGTPHHIPMLLSKQVQESRFYSAFIFPTTCGLVFKGKVENVNKEYLRRVILNNGCTLSSTEELLTIKIAEPPRSEILIYKLGAGHA